MYQPQCGIAVLHVFHEYAHRTYVVQITKFHALAFHLVDDAADMLGAAFHLGLNARLRQLLLQSCHHLGNVLLTIHTSLVQQTGYFLVELRFQVA